MLLVGDTNNGVPPNDNGLRSLEDVTLIPKGLCSFLWWTHTFPQSMRDTLKPYKTKITTMYERISQRWVGHVTLSNLLEPRKGCSQSTFAVDLFKQASSMIQHATSSLTKTKTPLSQYIGCSIDWVKTCFCKLQVKVKILVYLNTYCPTAVTPDVVTCWWTQVVKRYRTFCKNMIKTNN